MDAKKEIKPNACVASSKSLPLSDQTFFLCLRRKRLNETQLQQRIENLGGRLEKFFSSEVTCVLTDEPVCGKVTNSDKPDHDTKTFRRLNINEKAIAWGKKLWKIDTFLIWIRNQEHCKKLSVNNTAKKYLHKPFRAKLPVHLNAKRELTHFDEPFIKIENVSGEFRPYYKVFVNEPSICVRKMYPRSPFDDDKEQRSFVKRLKNSDDRKAPNLGKCRVTKQKPVAAAAGSQRQYCECCNIYFQNVEQHLQGPKHSQFVTKASNFDCLTDILDGFEETFVFKSDEDSTTALNPCTDLNESCESENLFKNSQICLPNANQALQCSFPHLPLLCNDLGYTFDSGATKNGYYIEDKPASFINFETLCMQDDFDCNKESNASISQLVDDPFLSCLDGRVMEKCLGQNIETKLDISGLHISSPEVFGITDPMFSEKSSEGTRDLGLQCFLNSIVKDSWMNDVLFSPVSQTSAQGIIEPAPRFGGDALCTAGKDFWLRKYDNERDAAFEFPYENAHLKYDWSVKYRSDTKIVILRTQKVIGVR